LASVAASAQTGIPVPRVSIGIDSAKSPQDVNVTLQLLLLLTILTLAPALLVMMTSFTRTIIVLSFARTALGTQNIPPNPVLIGLALFMTFFTMAPVLDQINREALQPYLNKKLSFNDAIARGTGPLREFMFRQTRQKDLALFWSINHTYQPQSRDDIPTSTLVPAFVISELKTSFWMGFKIYLPFLVIDIVVTSILMSMGMLFLPPIIISLPAKVLLFVMTDGWHQLARAIITSFS